MTAEPENNTPKGRAPEENRGSENEAEETKYLLFQLYGPMMSWGDVAMGEVRPTFDRPSKSSILGMVGAALGIRQSEEEKHRALAQGYRFAVRLDVPGHLLRDYHTVEVPEKSAPTRKDELAWRDQNTIQSYRDYRCDARATVCLWARGEPPWPLSGIREALESPEFTLYLGRKACPPALPLDPSVVKARSLRRAFEASEHSDDAFTASLMDAEETVRFYWEGHGTGFEADQVQTRRDQPVSRARWAFEDRQERYVALPEGDDAT
jgi:CRISPR system Cascade subunit CasD